MNRGLPRNAAGRTFTDRDGVNAPPVMMISQQTARRFWGEVDPLGRVVRLKSSGLEFTVVGVVGDVRNTALATAISPAMYFPAAARTWPVMDVALLIAAIGVYGVLSYSVNRRVREIGLRMALGAQQASVLRLVVREGMTVALAGIAAGLAGAFAAKRALSSLLFDVRADDPATFAWVAGILALIALAACLLPARRAARIDPAIALREE